jgi:Arc/MetJ-type ribon-helix-helix transcriptional regulator
MPTRKVELTEELDRFVESGVESGRFGDAGEAAREAEDRAKLEWLRQAAKEAFDSLDRGEGIVLNSDEELDLFFKGIREEVVSEFVAERKLA